LTTKRNKINICFFEKLTPPIDLKNQINYFKLLTFARLKMFLVLTMVFKVKRNNSHMNLEMFLIKCCSSFLAKTFNDIKDQWALLFKKLSWTKFKQQYFEINFNGNILTSITANLSSHLKLVQSNPMKWNNIVQMSF
jgi:hypothetical protein